MGARNRLGGKPGLPAACLSEGPDLVILHITVSQGGRKMTNSWSD